MTSEPIVHCPGPFVDVIVIDDIAERSDGFSTTSTITPKRQRPTPDTLLPGRYVFRFIILLAWRAT